MTKNIPKTILMRLALVACVAAFASPAVALEDGDRITLIVPYSAGGGFDTQTRLVAPYVEKGLRARGFPKVNVIVTNVRGGGGAIATSKVYTSKPDGTTLLFLDPGSSIWQQSLADAPFEVDKFGFIAQMSSDPFTMSVSINAGFDTWAAAVARSKIQPLLAGTGGQGAIDHIIPLIIEKLSNENGIGLRFAFVHMAGTSDNLASMRRGETEVSLKSTGAFQKVVDKGDAKFLWVYKEPGSPDRPYPSAKEVLGLSDDAMKRLGPGLVQRRVFVGPPGMDDKTLSLLREVFDEALTDPELIAKANKAKRPITYLSGEDARSSIQTEVQLSKDFGDHVRAALAN